MIDFLIIFAGVVVVIAALVLHNRWEQNRNLRLIAKVLATEVFQGEDEEKTYKFLKRLVK